MGVFSVIQGSVKSFLYGNTGNLPLAPNSDIKLKTDPYGRLEVVQYAYIVPSGVYVESFNFRSGVVVPLTGDYTASQITNVPASGITSTDVQGAINEVSSLIIASDQWVRVTGASNYLHPRSLYDSVLPNDTGNLGSSALPWTDLYLSDVYHHSASLEPLSPTSDSINMFVTASGVSPYREIAMKIKLQTGDVAVVSSTYV